jgi:hypothetical protein
VDPLDWVCEQGVVLQSARGPVPNLAEQIVGGPIRGSWWGHPSGHEIFAVLTRVLDSPRRRRDAPGKITLLHRRVWPALVRVADRFPLERLAAVDELHTRSGARRTIEVPSLSGSPPKTSPPRRCSPSTKRSGAFLPASAELDSCVKIRAAFSLPGTSRNPRAGRERRGETTILSRATSMFRT